VASSVRPTEIACRDHRGGHELDIVVLEGLGGAASRVTAIGEVKATNAEVNMRQLRRLEHLRGLLPSARVEQQPKLLLFSRSGFTTDLTEESAARPDIELISLQRIYRGA
jgi:hypothetical protein